jgi:hypothetical protein
VPNCDLLVGLARAFILFHDKRHPSGLGLPEVTHVLEHVVQTAPQPLLALAQARAALSLLYGGVLGIDPGELPQPGPPRLLDQFRQVLRVRHYSPRTEDCYVNWARRFILFHHKRHPRTMGVAEVEQFLTHLAVEGHVSASSQVLLGHESLETTMIYTHVARKGPAGVASPLDLLTELTPATLEASVAARHELQGGRQRRCCSATP